MKQKNSIEKINAVDLILVGVTGIEPATSRPPDAHSNRTELHPENRVQNYSFFLN